MRPGSDSPDETRKVPLSVLLMGLAAVLLALLIGTQVLPVLYALLFPPSPPLPDNLTLISHTSVDHGVDEWDYRSGESACDVVTFFQAHGVTCQIAAECNPLPEFALPASHISHCIGQMTFSSFAMRWQVDITPNFNGTAQIHLSRETYWSGVIPPLRETTTP